ncbi:MAG: 2-amino-4-hydroxy-6-hydroxymethyldihydropteridine diphosphokinase [Bacteriovoracaceae bacterium]|nr:2-amino-4-hydroxy-6-hydroxymethyldihydropteridine diphosphokinase [Bacteriovoracaceae bacterium]
MKPNLVLATGSNLGNRENNLEKAKRELCQIPLMFLGESQVIENPPVDFFDQPNFCNQVLEFEIPKDVTPEEFLKLIKNIELKIGRTPSPIDKGPRLIDIDIIFWGDLSLTSKELTIPHPAWKKRPFVFQLLNELPSWKKGNLHGLFSL